MNYFTFKDGVLILPTINRIHSDLYGNDKGYDHSLLKHKIESALTSLMYTSYYWRRFYGLKEDKTVNLDWIIEGHEFLSPQGGRGEIRPAVLFSEAFMNILDTSHAKTKGGFRRYSLDELLFCNTPTSRRLYEMVMMNIYGIVMKPPVTMTFDKFRDHFGLTGSMTKRPSEVLKRVQEAMDTFVSPIIGVTFEYHGKDMMFINQDLERTSQHMEMGNPDRWLEAYYDDKDV